MCSMGRKLHREEPDSTHINTTSFLTKPQSQQYTYWLPEEVHNQSHWKQSTLPHQITYNAFANPNPNPPTTPALTSHAC